MNLLTRACVTSFYVALIVTGGASAGPIALLSGHHRAGMDQNISADASFSFAVFERQATPGDVYGTGFAGFDNLFFNRGAGSPAFDTSAKYLYLYQYVNDGPGSDAISQGLGFTAGDLTSWGYWLLGLADSDGAVHVGNPLGTNQSNFSLAAPAVLAANGVQVADTLSAVPGSPDRRPNFMSYENGTLSVGFNLEAGNRLSIFGYTSDSPPVVRSQTLATCPDDRVCGGYVSANLLGDYDLSGRVDGADYAVWREQLGQTGVGLQADGDGNGRVTRLDYDIWRQQFGTSYGGDVVLFAPAPEPATLLFVGLIASASLAMRLRRGGGR